MDIKEQKAALRSRLRALRRSLPDEERTESANKVASRLADLPELVGAKTVLAYMPMRYELDILPAVEKLKGMGKSVAFPLCIEDGGLRLFVPEDENGFVSGAYGILEPAPEHSKEIKADELDAILLPAIGFDRRLNRLGQGGGYYDRLLERTDCFKAAVGFDCQLVDNVPTEGFDRPVDAVVIPSETILKQVF